MACKFENAVFGSKGLVGRAILDRVDKQTACFVEGRSQHDLRDMRQCELFFEWHTPRRVYIAAARVGGIIANKTYPVDFLSDNIRIALNVLECCHKYQVEKVLFLGSSCIYPKFAKQPITEDQLLAGHLEPTNSAYAIAKIAGIELAKAYRAQHGLNTICLMPCNLFGPGDNYSLEGSHVIPALIRKFHEAKEKNVDVTQMRGTGSALREFLYSEDCADACIHMMNNYDGVNIVNIGAGLEISIKSLASTIADIVGFKGAIEWDGDKSLDGTPRKVVDSSVAEKLGWKAKTCFETALDKTYADFLSHREHLREACPSLPGA